MQRLVVVNGSQLYFSVSSPVPAPVVQQKGEAPGLLGLCHGALAQQQQREPEPEWEWE